MNKGTAPLAGIRVLEVGRLIAAPFCAQVLADLGADVIKIERVGGGDEIRTYGPPFLLGDDAPGGASSYFLGYNRNKRSVAVDFSHSEGADLIRRLAATCDVFIENYKVGSLARYGLDEASLREVKPDIVYLSVSGFGQSGPYAKRPATDVAAQGMSGLMSMTGEPDGPAQKVGVSIVDMVTGLYGAIGVIASLYQCSKTPDGGQWVGVSLLDSAMTLMGQAAVWTRMTGGPPLRTGNDGLGSAPSGLFTCRDGEILIQAGKDADFVKLCRVLGLESLTRDPRFERGASRVEKFHELKLLVNAATGRWERAALYAAMVKEGIICGPVNDVADALADPQVRANGVEQPGGHPDDPSLTLVGSPLRFAAGAPAIVRHPPRIGEHTVSVLQDLLGLEASAIASLAEKGVIGLPRESANSLAASERNGHAASLRLDTA